MHCPVELMAEKKDQHWVAGHGSWVMGHAVVSAKRVYTPPSVISIESIIECQFTIAPKKKFTLSKAIRNDLLQSVIYWI